MQPLQPVQVRLLNILQNEYKPPYSYQDFYNFAQSMKCEELLDFWYSVQAYIKKSKDAASSEQAPLRRANSTGSASKDTSKKRDSIFGVLGFQKGFHAADSFREEVEVETSKTVKVGDVLKVNGIDTEIDSDVRMIIVTFMKPESPKEVNLPNRIIVKFNKDLESGVKGQELFKSSLDHIENLLSTSCLSEFIKKTSLLPGASQVCPRGDKLSIDKDLKNITITPRFHATEHIDKEKLYSTLLYRFNYICKFMDFGDPDIKILKDSSYIIAPLVPTIVDAVYEKLFQFDITKNFFFPSAEFNESNPGPDIDDEPEEIQMRKDTLTNYLTKLVTAEYDLTFISYLDTVAKLHVHGNGNSVDQVHINALFGWLHGFLVHTIDTLAPLQSREFQATRAKILAALSKLLWIQNDFFIKYNTDST